MLKGMSFTIVCDRLITDYHHISPGGYEVNGKKFDFCSSVGATRGRERMIEVYDIDESYTESDITSEDIHKPFTEFFVFTGENTDPEIQVEAIKDLCFYFEDGKIECSDEVLRSVNECLNS